MFPAQKINVYQLMVNRHLRIVELSDEQPVPVADAPTPAPLPVDLDDLPVLSRRNFDGELYRFADDVRIYWDRTGRAWQIVRVDGEAQAFRLRRARLDTARPRVGRRARTRFGRLLTRLAAAAATAGRWLWRASPPR